MKDIKKPTKEEEMVEQLTARNADLERMLKSQNEVLAQTKSKAFDMVAKEQESNATYERFLGMVAEKLQCERSFDHIVEALNAKV